MKLRYDRRILLLTIAAGLPGTAAALLLLWTGGYATQTIALYGFQTAYLRFDFGYAAALSVLALFCLMAFTVVYVRASGVTKE